MALQGRHKSLDKEVKLSVRWLEAIPQVTKVILGFSESCRHKYPPGFIKFKLDVPGGIKVNGYSGNGVTDMFVRITPANARAIVKELISARFVQN
jgi:hypothetical protein